jgi:hypothetical protein
MAIYPDAPLPETASTCAASHELVTSPDVLDLVAARKRSIPVLRLERDLRSRQAIQ